MAENVEWKSIKNVDKIVVKTSEKKRDKEKLKTSENNTKSLLHILHVDPSPFFLL